MSQYNPTAKPSKLTDWLVTNLDDKKEYLGIRRVYFCDQEYIPEVPAVCIEPGRIDRELSGAPFRTNNQFTIPAIVYAADIDGVEEAQRDADLVSERVVEQINSWGLPENMGGSSFGGYVVWGMVASSEYGYVVKANKLMRANRMIITAMSKTNLLET